MQVPQIFRRTTVRAFIIFIILMIGLCSSVWVSALASDAFQARFNAPKNASAVRAAIIPKANFLLADTIPPTVTINQADEQPDPTGSSPINFTVIFSEPVIGFQTGDVTLSGTAGATNAIVSDSGDSTFFNVFVSGMTTNGTVIASIAEGKATDVDGNPNTASTSRDNTVTFNGFEVSNTLTVTKTDDTNDGACDADCSLREAIVAANGNPGADTIAFNIPASDPGRNATTGVFTISVIGALPQITDQVTIDGYTQGTISTPGDTSDDATPNTNPLSSGLNTHLLIELTQGTSVVALRNVSNLTAVGFNGLDFGTAAFNSRIRGLAIYGFASGAGINITDAEGVRVDGNFLGVRADGSTIASNDYGVRLTGAPRTLIGGTTADTSNLISGNNEAGVLITNVVTTNENRNSVQNNLIGTNALGVAGLPNAEAATGVNKGGVIIINASGVRVGLAGAGNVISGNNGIGIIISPSTPGGRQTSDNIVQANLIGVTANGLTALANSGDGVEINDSQNNLIGGTNAGEGNTISSNTANGVALTGSTSNDNSILGNTLTSNGMDGVLISSGTGNRINSNSIFSNGQQGIDLLGDGVTPNDPQDADPVAGLNANNLQNFPVITSAVRNTITSVTTITGTLDGGTPNTIYTIELFSNTACDGTNGEGQTILGNVTSGAADVNGDVSFTFITNANVSSRVITATATNESTNDTSEFSACAPVTDFTPPPSAPDLQSASDTGTSNTDNLTSDNSPTFDISSVAAGVTVELLRDGVVVANGTASGATISLTDPGPVPDGVHNYTSRQTGGSATSAQSGALQVTIDTSAPTVTINQAQGQADPTSTSPINFTVVFSDPVNGFQTGDVSLSGTAGATTATVSPVGSAGTTYHVAVSGMTSSGTVVASIAAGVATDAAGNANTASTSTDNVVTFNSPGQLRFQTGAFNVSESGGNATIIVTRTGGSGGQVSATFSTSDGTATAGSDYTAVNNFTVTFADGDSADKTINVSISNDSLSEPDETVNLTLTNPTGGATLGSPSSAVLTINDDDPAGGTFKFSQPTYTVQENSTSMTVTVERTGQTAAATVDYATRDMTATQRSDYTLALGTLSFAAGETQKTLTILINEDSYIEGTEAFSIDLSSPTGGAVVGQPSSTTVEITDDVPETTGNPIDDPESFVREHYHDFLNREPDADGLAFWRNEITSCGSDAACVEVKRQNVSAAFFLSMEFQETGFLIHRFYNAALERPNGLPRYTEFMRDTQEVSRDVVVNKAGWQAQLVANQQSRAEEFVTRAEFLSLYPQSLTPAEFVDALYAHARVTPSTEERQAAIAEFGNTGTSADTGARGRVLLRVAENQTLKARESNRSFVLMQYFGYLRRNPDDAPDSNLDGYNFWLTKLNAFSGDFVKAEMVKAFINSGEYRQRFGQ